MKKKGLIVFITLLLPMSMLGSTETIFTWGYGNVMWEVLQALKGLTTELDYLVKTALAIAIFIFSISKALDSKTNPVFEIGKLFMLYGVVYFFFLSPSNNTYVIHDEVTNKDYKVSQIPMGIGNSVSLMSRLEKAILDGMEKHYSTPNSIAYSKAGLGFSLNSMMDIPSLRPSSIGMLNLQNNMDLYIRNCLQYNTLSGAIDMDEVVKSSNLLKVLFLKNDGKLGVYKDLTTGKKQVMSCGDIATRLEEAFEQTANEALSRAGQRAGVGTLTEYISKFENVVPLFFGQAAGAREQFQQALVMNSLDDGIVNTAKMLGLNAQSLAANTAIADQTITTSMQAQGRLAQTYLPLAKAYMSIIIVGLSWLIALVSIMFGSYTHIKMFFTLCLSMILWTPILSLISYLNDLNIQNVFADLILKDDSALSYSNFKEVVSKITENSNFLKYMVMLTPVLAFSLAKGSEMGFVSIASSLSQQIAGGARAAGSFATQQALSTGSAISSPDGSMVSSLTAGKREEVFATNVGGSVVNMSNIGTLGGMLNESVTTAGGSSGVSNANGVITAMSLKGFSGSDMSAMQKDLRVSATNSLDNLLSTSEGRQILANAANQVGSTATHDKGIGVDDSFGNAISKLNNTATTHTEQEITTKNLSANADIGLGGSMGPVSGGGSVGAGIKKDWVDTDNTSTSTGEGRVYNDNFQLSETEKATLMQNKAFVAALQDQINTSTSQETRQSIQSLKSYSEVASFAQNWSVDSAATMVQNYMNANNCSMADAMVALEQAAATKDYATISQYAGVADNSGLNGNNMQQAQNTNHFNPQNVINQHGANATQALEAGQTRLVKDPNTGQEQIVSGGVANFYRQGAIQTLDNTEGKAGVSNVPPNDFNNPANKYLKMSDTTFTKMTLNNPQIVNILQSVKTSIQNKGDNSITKGF